MIAIYKEINVVGVEMLLIRRLIKGTVGTCFYFLREKMDI